MKKESFYDPRAAYNIPTQPFQDMGAQLEQHNAETPEDKVTGQPLLAAGLGAAGVMAGLGGSEYLKGKSKHVARVDDIAYKMYKSRVEPHNFKADNKLFQMVKPVDAKLTKNLRNSNLDNIGKFIGKYNTKDASKGAGLKAAQNMSKGKLAAGAAAGGLLGYLANQLISRQQEGEK